MSSTLHDRVEAIAGQRPSEIHPLHGGMIGEVYRVNLPDGERLVAKVNRGGTAPLDIEGYMLRYLAENSQLPVPQVLHSEPDLLLMTFIEGSSSLGADVQTHAAELLAALHSVRGNSFGLERDTLIGSLHQPNVWSAHWVDFFREQRLLYMAREAVHEGSLSPRLMARLETFAERLDDFIDEPTHPALIHGDMWTTNILAADGRVTGFVDPAIYYAHPEIELAFSTLFGTFGAPFFERYRALAPLKPGFFETRRDIYNLYPLLVHVRLFGGGYVQSVESILSRLGF
jgi:fructosamine-3-kinase